MHKIDDSFKQLASDVLITNQMLKVNQLQESLNETLSRIPHNIKHLFGTVFRIDGDFLNSIELTRENIGMKIIRLHRELEVEEDVLYELKKRYN